MNWWYIPYARIGITRGGLIVIVFLALVWLIAFCIMGISIGIHYKEELHMKRRWKVWKECLAPLVTAALLTPIAIGLILFFKWCMGDIIIR